VLQLPAHRGEEGAGALLGGGDEQECRAEAVAPAPRFGLRVLGVARRLLLEAAMRHRPDVQLDEGEQAAPVGLGDLDERVGGDGALLPRDPGGERLACFGLALEAGERHTVRQHRLQRHVDLAQPGGMGEEQRIRLAPLAAPWRRSSGDDRLAPAGRPEVVRCRSPFAVGAAAAGESVAGEPGAAVAQRPRGRLGVDGRELGLGQHPVRGEQTQDAQVEIGERRGPRRGAGAASA
jgi:hypothetical protein